VFSLILLVWFSVSIPTNEMIGRVRWCEQEEIYQQIEDFELRSWYYGTFLYQLLRGYSASVGYRLIRSQKHTQLS